MEPSSRTPEGRPSLCSVCGNQVHISPSWPTGDAPCPCCGHLLWFDSSVNKRQAPSPVLPAQRQRSVAVGHASTEAASGLPDKRPAELTGQGKFTLVDFRNAMGQLKKLGPLQQIMRWIPGMGKVAQMMASTEVDPEEDLKQIEGIIDSMTPGERENPDHIDVGRRVRIAEGSGTYLSDVDKLLKEFSQMAGMMQSMAGMSKLGQMRQLKQMADGGQFNPGGQHWTQRGDRGKGR